MVQSKTKELSMKDFKKRFKYEVWVGYEWVEVEYPKNGFSKSQLQAAIDKNIVRHLNQPL